MDTKPPSLVPLRVWRTLLCEVFWLRRGSIQPRHQGIEVDQAIAIGWCVERGGARLVDPQGREERFPAGTWVFPSDAQALVQSFDPGTRLISLRFALEWPDGRPLFERTRTVSFSIKKHPRLLAMTRALLRVSQANQLPFGPQQISALMRPMEFLERQQSVIAWLTEFSQAMLREGVRLNEPSSTDERITRALQFIAETPWSTPLREPDLARLSGISVSQMNKLFVKETGKTPAAWREIHRFRLVQIALLEGTGTVKETAYAFGFRSLSHFSVWFKRHAGEAPTLYGKGAVFGGSG